MKEKNIDKYEFDKKIEEIKQQMWEEAKVILETDYPRKDGQLDGEATSEMAKLQSKYNKIFKELKERYK